MKLISKNTAGLDFAQRSVSRLMGRRGLFQTGFRRGGFSYLRHRETAGGLRFMRQGHVLTVGRLSKIAWLDGDVRTISRPIDPIASVLLSQKGSLFLTRPLLFHYIARREELEASANELFNVVTSGKVRIKVNQRFALKDAADAHKTLEARATSGATVLTI